MTKSVNSVQELGGLANSLTRDYSALAGDCRGAVAASTNPQVGDALHTVRHTQLGTGVAELSQRLKIVIIGQLLKISGMWQL